MILAIDTATGHATLALGTPADPGADLAVPGRRELSRDIERFAAGLLARRGVGPESLSAVLLADGPGAFTGLRIGAAFAKGLCRSVGVPLLVGPSLLGAAAAAAAGSEKDRPVTVIASYDALRGERFCAVYRIGEADVETLEVPALVAVVAERPGAILATERDASASALLALVGLPGGPTAVERPAAFEPVYGRLAEAEARRLAREGRAG